MKMTRKEYSRAMDIITEHLEDVTRTADYAAHSSVPDSAHQEGDRMLTHSAHHIRDELLECLAILTNDLQMHHDWKFETLDEDNANE